MFSRNLKHLRKKRELTQQKLADALIITRARLAKYEEGKSEPPIEILKRFAHFFNVSIDLMVSVDLEKVPMDHILKMDNNRILLPIMIDSNDLDQVELVHQKARAGYLAGYADPEYIEQLDRMSLPILGQGKHRAFYITGDSMMPVREGAIIVGRFLERFRDLVEGKTYIVVSQNDGIAYKRVFRKDKRSKTLVLHSDNQAYAPYELHPSEILELWEFAAVLHLSDDRPEEASINDVIGYLQRIEGLLA